MGVIGRRRFLESTAALAALAVLRPRLAAAAGTVRMAVSIGMLPAALPFLDRFRLARDAGFAGIEMRTAEDPAQAELIRDSAERAGLRIHSVLHTSDRCYALSSADPAVLARAVAMIATSLNNAKLWGADAVVLAPAAGDPNTSYRDAWSRSQAVLRERVLPLARELEMVLAVERVWDGFLLGPPELTRYVDAFASPWVRAACDTGNVVFYAYPQDWIRALGSRIAKVRVSDADVDGLEVRRALGEIDYDGWVTAEFATGPAADLREVVARLDRQLGA